MGTGVIWLIYALAVLIISGVVGMHLGRFRAAYTEMTGMMAGMTMGMMNGFVLGYASAAAVASVASAAGTLLWGNFFGMLLGLLIGVYFGRAGGLMGMMDGGMGGVMGGSMGAMLAAMLVFPPEGLMWTAVLLGVLYLISMLGLVALIEQSAPEHAALHRILPMFTKAMAAEASEEAQRADLRSSSTPRSTRITDYYSLLGVRKDAGDDAITDAYLARLAESDQTGIARLEQAMAILSDPYKREIYDKRLAQSQASTGRGDCCPPLRKAPTAVQPADVTSQTVVAPAIPSAAPRRDTGVTVTAQASSNASPRDASVPYGKPHSARQATAQSRPQADRHAGKSAHENGKQAQQKREAPISVVGIVAGAVILALLLGWWAIGQGGSGSGVVLGASSSGSGMPSAQQLEAKAVSPLMGADGVQTVDVVINGTTMSYKPSIIKVKQNLPVRFNLTTEGRDPG